MFIIIFFFHCFTIAHPRAVRERLCWLTEHTCKVCWRNGTSAFALFRGGGGRAKRDAGGGAPARLATALEPPNPRPGGGTGRRAVPTHRQIAGVDRSGKNLSQRGPGRAAAERPSRASRPGRGQRGARTGAGRLRAFVDRGDSAQGAEII